MIFAESGSNLPEWVAAGATLLAIVVALFQNQILAIAFPSKLRLEFHPEYCDLFPIRRRSSWMTGATHYLRDAHWFRLWIDNSEGYITAEDVQVIARRVFYHDGQDWQPVKRFVPAPLGWSHVEETRPMNIPAGTGRLCDFGFVPCDLQLEAPPSHPANLVIEEVDSEQTLFNRPFIFKLIMEPSNAYNAMPRGRYKTELQLVAHNAELSTYTIEFEWTGVWDRSIFASLQENIKISAPVRTSVTSRERWVKRYKEFVKQPEC